MSDYPTLITRIGDASPKEMTLEPDGSIPVTLQDQTTPVVLVKANQVVASSTVAVTATLGASTISITNASGMSVGQLLFLTSTVADRYYQGRILSITPGTPYVVALDTPLDYAFEAGQDATSTITDMSVNGSVTPQTFGLRASEPTPGINLTVDVTEIILQCETATATSLNEFGDIAALTKGLVLRRVDGTYQNIFNVKDGHEIQNVTGTYVSTEASNPGLGVYGFSAVLRIAGQSNLGVTVRVATGEDLQFVVQDNLTGLTRLEAMFKGSVVR